MPLPLTLSPILPLPLQRKDRRKTVDRRETPVRKKMMITVTTTVMDGDDSVDGDARERVMKRMVVNKLVRPSRRETSTYMHT